MKSAILTLAFASLAVSASAVADEAIETRTSNIQPQFFNVAAAPRTSERDTQKPQKEKAAKDKEASNALPDPAYMPYVNGVSE